MEYYYLLNYLNSNLSLFIDDIILKKDYSLFFSDTDRREYWNSCFNFNLESVSLKKIEDEFYLRNLNPSFWITDSDYKTRQILQNSSYINRKTDYWMILEDKKKFQIDKLDIQKVINQKHINDYMEVFFSEYNDKYLKYHKMLNDRLWSKSIQSYILYEDKVPVSIGSETEFDDIGLIQSLVTREEYRHKSYGYNVCRSIINDSNASKFFLRSDINGSGIKLYQNLGFKELMRIGIFSKKKIKDLKFIQKMKYYRK